MNGASRHDPSVADDVPFDWKFEPTRIAGRTIDLAVATDPDAMLIDACRRQDAGETDVVDPFWATTWRAAAGLDLFLSSRDLRGVPVLEVGCGTGHAGIAAAIGGANVTMTDGVEDPLALVRLSIAKNAAVFKTPPTVCRLRLGIDALDATYPIILGSDVTYLRELWPQLIETADHHLTADGEVWLSDPHRIIANEFLRWMDDRSRRSAWRTQTHRVVLADRPDHPIRVICLSRS